MSDAMNIAQRYIALWNEKDAGRRAAMLAELWTEDAAYLDPLMAGRGRAEIDALIAAVQARFPDFRFALAGAPDGYAQQLRFSWELGPAGAPAVVKGTDFAELDGERLRRVVGFLDQVPGGA